MDIASPWDHRVYEKEGEKIDKYQDLKREIRKLCSIRQYQVIPVVIDGLKAVCKGLATWLDKLGIPLGKDCCRKQLFGNSKDLKEGVGKVRRMKDSRDLWPFDMARSLSLA